MTDAYKYLAGGVLFVIYSVVLGGSFYFSGYKSSDADHAANAVEVGQSMARLGLVIQKQQAKNAETTRQKQLAEKGRIDAINTTGHQTEKIALLESRLAEIMRESATRAQNAGNLQNPADGRYHVFDSSVIERVWNRASGN